MKKTHILLVAALCMVSAALGALTVKLDSTSQAGAASSDSSSPVPAFYFHDVDGTIMDAEETQTLLRAKGITDRDGNEIDIDGAWGGKTIYGVNRYIGNCYGNDVMSLFGVK